MTEIPIDATLRDIYASRDTSIRPQDDLFRHVNGTWLKENEIPADLARYGSFIMLHLKSEEQVRDIIESVSVDSDDPIEAKIAGFYRSYMDIEKLNDLGTSPLQVDLDLIDDAADKDELAVVFGRLMNRAVRGPFEMFVDANLNDPTTYIGYLGQGGLTLPDEAYYREDAHRDIREAFKEFIPGFLELVRGFDADDAALAATTIYDIEEALASHHMNIVDCRDTDKINNVLTWEEFTTRASGFPWAAAIEAYGVPASKLDPVLVLHPDALAGFASQWEARPLEDWKLYLMWRLICSRASLLTEEISAAAFEFFGKKLQGAQEQRERWKRGISFTTGALSEAIGKVYVARHFPPSHKEKMLGLVNDLLAAYKESITSIDWMSEETKERALTKLSTFVTKIGYPDKWLDYSSLEMSRDSLIDNAIAAERFEIKRALDKLGNPVDRDEWHMPPQMVNAYYNPTMNEIVFPAAILQDPFFNPDVDDAWNYGGIGAVIGHEIGHGFDDKGSLYDETGTLNNWWTDADRKAFDARTDKLVAQYDAFIPAQLGPDSEHHVIGALTLGENIGDLSGLTIALKAYDIAMKRAGYAGGAADAPVMDGVTGIQRVILSYARVWKSKSRDEQIIQQMATDPHSPEEFRCNGIVRNLDAFADAFDVHEGDGLWLAPDERVVIW